MVKHGSDVCTSVKLYFKTASVTRFSHVGFEFTSFFCAVFNEHGNRNINTAQAIANAVASAASAAATSAAAATAALAAAGSRAPSAGAATAAGVRDASSVRNNPQAAGGLQGGLCLLQAFISRLRSFAVKVTDTPPCIYHAL